LTLSLFNILLFVLFFIWIHLLIFFRNRMGKLLIINLVPVLLVTVPLSLQYNDIHLHMSSIMTFMGLILFPYTFAYLVLDFFPVLKKEFLKQLLMFLVLLFPVLVLLDDHRYIIIQILHIIVYMGIIIRIYDKLLVKVYISSILVFPLLFLLWNIYSIRNADYLLLSIIIQYIITYLVILFEFSRTLFSTNYKLTNVVDQNIILDQRITRLKQNNDQLRRIIGQKDTELQQLSRHASLAEITTGIAHELAQPLTGIKGVSQNMIDDIKYEEFDNLQGIADLERIVGLVDRSSSIIDHIRTFSRKRGYSFRPVDLNVCLLDVIDLLKEQMRKNDIEIIFILDDCLPKITGDNLSLEQVFINIIINAKDAILQRKENEDINGQIVITTKMNGDFVQLDIEDNGGGIPDHIIPKIWTPFFTTKNRGRGTGIGLSLSSKILKKHMAEAEIRKKGQSTIFTILFPVDQYETSVF